MIFIPKPIEDLDKYVRIAYKGDKELLSKYHVDKYTLKEAVNVTMGMIKVTAKEVDMNCSGVCLGNGVIIGYVCYFKNNLYSFGINIKYRTKEVLVEFWEIIVYLMKEGFITLLYPNNTRAINFLIKCGMRVVEDFDANFITLIKTK